jgi:hypothetical protein
MFVAFQSWYRKQRIKFAIKIYNWVMPQLTSQEVDDVFIYRLTRQKTFKKLVPLVTKPEDKKLMHFPRPSDVIPPSQALPSTDKHLPSDAEELLKKLSED